MSKELLKQALVAIDHLCKNTRAERDYDPKIVGDAVKALEQALAEPEQEPVAVVGGQRKGWFYLEGHPNVQIGDKLYTAPTPRKPLTDEEIGLLTTDSRWSGMESPGLLTFTRAIEAAHGITNETN